MLKRMTSIVLSVALVLTCLIAGLVLPTSAATDLLGDSYELPSATFYLVVKRAAMDYDTVDSDSDIMEIIDVMSKADQLIEAAETIEEAAEEIKKGGYVGKEEMEALEEDIYTLFD